MRRRIGRVVDDQRQRLRNRMAYRALQGRNEAVVGLDLHRSNHAARHDEAEGMDRIGRVRAQHDVAWRGDGLRHVGEALLRAERGDDLGLRIDFHAEAARIIGGLCAAKPGDAPRGGIAVGARIAHHVAQLIDDGLRGRQVRIAHAQIDDVGAPRPGTRLQAIDLFEDVRRQPADLVKLFHCGSSMGRGSDARDIHPIAGRVDTPIRPRSRAGLPSGGCATACAGVFLRRRPCWRPLPFHAAAGRP